MGRRGLRADIRQLIVRMVKENPTWGQERIAAELWLKLGVEHAVLKFPPFSE
jgi:putative transposase